MVTRAHQGFLYRVADRARAAHCDDLKTLIDTAKSHAKTEFNDQALADAIDLLSSWLEKRAPEPSELWLNILRVQDDVDEANQSDIAKALAASAWLRSEQLKTVASSKAQADGG